MSCFFFFGDWISSTKAQCGYIPNMNYAIAYVPYWFRFAQCFRKYKDTEVRTHLINAGKYFMNIVMQFASMMKGLKIVGNELYVPIAIASTLYSYSWDLYMDWGLLRS